MTSTHITQLIDALIALFDPVVQAVEDTDSAEALLKDMGYQAPNDIRFLDDFSPLLNTLLTLSRETDDLLRGDSDPDYLALFRSLTDAVQDITKLIRNVGTTLQGHFPAEFLAATDMVEQFPRQLVDYLLVRMIERKYPVLHSSLLVIGIIDQGEVTLATTSFTVPYKKRVIRWEKLGDYVSAPLHSMQEAYRWNTDNFDYDSLIGNVHRFGRSIRFFSSPANADPDTLRAFHGGMDIVTHENVDTLGILKFPLVPILDSPIGVEVYPVLNTTRDKATGFGLGLYFDPSAGLNFPVTDELSLGIKYAGTDSLDAGILVLPDQPLQLVSNIFGGSGPPADLSTVIPEFTFANTEQKTLLFDSSVAKLEFASWALRMGVFTGVSGVYIETDIRGATLTIGASQGDGFLQEILPSQPIALDFDLRVGFSSKTGLYFGGSAGLEATLPVSLSISSVLTVPAIHLSLKAEEAGLKAEVSASVRLSIGPVHAVIERVGTEALLTFPENWGNLGPADLDIAFKPPTGVGISIDAPGVVGGGFLRFAVEQHEYSGVVHLEIAEKIAVKAIGLLSTRLPEGGKGYSLVLIIFVEGFTPIQLGFGFALTGIGGLLAVNRTVNEEALRAGLKHHTLDSILFPPDPIRNAPQILSNLNRVFPPATGHHLFGPMVQVSWGTPPLITAELGVVLELGARLRLLILAQIAAILPRRDQDLVRLQMDAVGVLDFDHGTASLDAVLHDSRLLKKFVLTGEMALRLKWEGTPHFALAVGGLHPAFHPPPNFPKLERIAINLSSGDNPRIRCEAYFAITANTVQFGARAELYAAASGFSIQGDIGYDVLIQLDPFCFLAEFHAQLQLKRGSTNLFKVKVEGSLAGPRPLHLKGKATFEILWWDVTVRVDTTLVKGEPPPGPAPIDVLPRLQEALRQPESWTTQMPVGQRALVTLTARPGTTDLLLHPLGTLLVKENVVPLNVDLSRFGPAVPAGARRFAITSVTVGEDPQTPSPVRDFFAPAQFLELTDGEKLSRPSFEPMDAGVTVLSDAMVVTADATDWLEVEAIECETWILDKGTTITESDEDVDAQGQRQFYRLSPVLLSRQARFGAAGSSELRRTGRAKYHVGSAKHQVIREGWAIVDRAHLTAPPVTGAAGRASTYSEAVAELHRLQQAAPTAAGRFGIMRPSELQRA